MPQPRVFTRSLLAALVPLVVHAVVAGAQHIGITPLVTLTGDAEERARLAQLVGGASSAGFLIRSASRLSLEAETTQPWLAILTPEIRAVHNSGIPFSMNDGPLWAGRGTSDEITAGIAFHAGPVRVMLAPTYVRASNDVFQIIPYPQKETPQRSVWANPFHPPPESIDLPLRFGDKRIERVDAGQSSLMIQAGRASFGAATENLWWGPGIRNAITLSNNAGGFPHLFLQTSRPLHTRAGDFDAQWILGQLSESDFFDADHTNDRRSLSGAVVAWTPRSDTAITIGVARLAMATQNGRAFPFGAAFDVLRSAGHANADTLPVTGTGRDQITSFFARWVLPASGFEAYAEWARFEEPKSLRDFLEYPGHSEGYTLGLQWAGPLVAKRMFRLQSEVSYLEPDPSLRLRPVATTYTSRAVPQGFTQRGQTLGAAIGPGASSQWIAGEVFAPSWRIGPYLSRIRWDNGVLFEPIVPGFKRQDVTLSAGLRAAVSWKSMSVLVDFAHSTRFNYLFQSYILTEQSQGGIDLVNNTLSLTLSTDRWRR